MKQNGASDALARVVAVNAPVIGRRRGRYLAALVYLRAATTGPLGDCSHSNPQLALALVRRLRVLFRGRSGEADHSASAFAGRRSCLRPSPLTLNGIG